MGNRRGTTIFSGQLLIHSCVQTQDHWQLTELHCQLLLRSQRKSKSFENRCHVESVFLNSYYYIVRIRCLQSTVSFSQEYHQQYQQSSGFLCRVITYREQAPGCVLKCCPHVKCYLLKIQTKLASLLTVTQKLSKHYIWEHQNNVLCGGYI